MDVPLSVLGQRLRALTARRVGLAAFLWGEAGIGKSYTSRALLRETPCRSLTLPAALPLPELIRALPRPPRPRAWMQAALDSLQAGQSLTTPTADVLATLLGQLAPFVLYLEDLHEADDSQKELTCQVAASVARTRGAGLLVSSRLPPPLNWPDSGLMVLLERLSLQVSAALLEAEAGTGLPDEASVWIYGRACGNPLFTLEYFRLLARQGHLWNGGDRWRWRVPSSPSLPVTVEALIERTLQDASEGPPGTVLQTLALLPEVTQESLCACTDLTDTEVSQALGLLERVGILRGNAFVHPLYRELALSLLPPGRREPLARRALDIWQGDLGSAAHLVDAAQLQPEAALNWFLGAARQLQAVGDPVRAARLLAKAVSYADPATAAGLALEAAQALQEIDVPEATRLAKLAAQSPVQSVQAIWLQAELLAAQGQGHQAEELLNCLYPAERQGTAFVARVLGLRVQDNERLLELLDQHPEALLHATPAVMYRVGRALAYTGRTDEAAALAQQLWNQPGLPTRARVMALKVNSVVAQVQADFGAMERLEREVFELVQPSGNLRLMDAALFNRAMALGTLGRYAERTACLAQALAICQELGDPAAYAIAQTSYGGALTETGAYAQAETELLEALALLEGLELTGYLVDCKCALSALYRHWQPPHGRVLAVRFGLAALRDAQTLGDQWALAGTLPTASLACTWTGQPLQALDMAEQAVTLATQLGMSQLLQDAQAARGAALVALHRPEAMAALSLAESLAHEMGDLLAAHLVGLELDALNRDEAAAQTRLAWFEARGLGQGMDKARQLFPALQRTFLESKGQSPLGEAANRLDVLGEMRCGPVGKAETVRGRKRRDLLACLLEGRLRGRPNVSRPELMDRLYPQIEENRAAAALKELVHQTRAALEPGVIQTTEDGYTLGELQSDAEVFLKTGETRLWRGLYLAGNHLEADALIQDALTQALCERAAAVLAADPAEAARVGRLLCEVNPYDQAALALTLRALRAAGSQRSLRHFYASARQGFEEVGEDLPEDWAAFLELRGTGSQAST
ncbi:AAA family ATPase [Deinococcus marmoris]|uniref:AAA family ATPase n=3 Tax=Deinococcus marmoris TaxID=249408 RepID=UPI0009DCA44C|nr:AAA family ATPase [Deinococcus marmoris]